MLGARRTVIKATVSFATQDEVSYVHVGGGTPYMRHPA